MNKLIIRSCLLGSLICSPLLLSSNAAAAPSAAVTELLTEYQQRGAGNCKWTLDRECTAQEKGDFLTWLSQQ